MTYSIRFFFPPPISLSFIHLYQDPYRRLNYYLRDDFFRTNIGYVEDYYVISDMS